MLVISPTAQISKLADIEDSVRGTRITIGDGVFIDAFVKLRVAGGSGDVTIGPNCYINAGSVLYSGNGITLGEYVLIAANCTLAPTNHEYGDPDVVIRKQDTANTGDIIVALIDDEEATLKRLRKRGSSIALEAANPAYETRVLGPDRVQIQGRLVSLVRRY